MQKGKFITLILLFTAVQCSLNDKSNQKTSYSEKDTASESVERAVTFRASDTTLNPYPYDTILTGGYSLSYVVNGNVQYLFLRKNDFKKKISENSKGLPHKNLGYVAADFKNYFVLAHSYGSGNPHYIELIRKKDGLNVLSEDAVWIAADERQEFLVYCNSPTPDIKDKILLYNVGKRSIERFDFPKEIYNDPTVINSIILDTVTKDRFVISYEINDSLFKKSYRR